MWKNSLGWHVITVQFQAAGAGPQARVFVRAGRFEELAIDFEAMAAHIRVVHTEARKAGIDIWR